MSIEDEIKASKGYLLKFVREDIKIPILTIDNVARVEAMIYMNSTYSNNSNEYSGNTSTNYFMRLREIIKQTNEKSLKDDENIAKTTIFKIITTLDNENSTHLNANTTKDAPDEEKGRFKIAKAILELEKEEFVNHLKDIEKSLEPNGLFRIIENKNTGGRKNTSFASKFCHYACFSLFDDENKDNYSIYDTVIRMALPVYIKWHKVNIENINYKNEYSKIKNVLDKIDYKLYQSVVDTVIKASESDISRNGFDHLLWYYFKGKNEKEIEEIYNSIDFVKNQNNPE